MCLVFISRIPPLFSLSFLPVPWPPPRPRLSLPVIPPDAGPPRILVPCQASTLSHAVFHGPHALPATQLRPPESYYMIILFLPRKVVFGWTPDFSPLSYEWVFHSRVRFFPPPCFSTFPTFSQLGLASPRLLLPFFPRWSLGIALLFLCFYSSRRPGESIRLGFFSFQVPLHTASDPVGWARVSRTSGFCGYLFRSRFLFSFLTFLLRLLGPPVLHRHSPLVSSIPSNF